MALNSALLSSMDEAKDSPVAPAIDLNSAPLLSVDEAKSPPVAPTIDHNSDPLPSMDETQDLLAALAIDATDAILQFALQKIEEAEQGGAMASWDACKDSHIPCPKGVGVWEAVDPKGVDVWKAVQTRYKQWKRLEIELRMEMAACKGNIWDVLRTTKYFEWRETGIILGEEMAAWNACKNMHVPHPKGDVWKAIQTKYNLRPPIPHDRILSKVELPPGWQLVWKGGRNSEIVDEDGTVVGKTFLKMTCFDRRGLTLFNATALKKIGPPPSTRCLDVLRAMARKLCEK